MEKKTNNKEFNSHNIIGEELVKRYPVDDTPFEVIHLTDINKIFGSMGKYKITEDHNSIEECIKDLQSITWNRILTVSLILNEYNKIK